MVVSMTGFGKAVRDEKNCFVSVEIRSVNNRHLNLKNHLPSFLSSLESKINDIIRKKVTRGTIDVFVKVDLKKPASTLRINEQAIKGYIAAAAAISKMTGSGDEKPAADALLSLPGVVELKEEKETSTTVNRAVIRAVEKALHGLSSTRAAEGRRLAVVIRQRRASLGRKINRIKKRTPLAHRQHVKRLKKRVGDLLERQALKRDDPALMREIAFLAERSDITEELDRLASHLKHFDSTMKSEAAAGPEAAVGRPLDFIIQEMGREINTIGAKASDARISHHVVSTKAELEKIREQVQNIE